jgi:hypothetical protein
LEFYERKAEARLDGGKTAEVVLKKFPGMTSEPSGDEEPEVLGGTT